MAGSRGLGGQWLQVSPVPLALAAVIQVPLAAYNLKAVGTHGTQAKGSFGFQQVYSPVCIAIWVSGYYKSGGDRISLWKLLVGVRGRLDGTGGLARLF